jgi:ketosteroid isomerase-like protein
MDSTTANMSKQSFDTPQVQFVLKFFDHLSARDLDAGFSLLSDTVVYELWPASLAHAPRTKSEYKALLDTNPDRDVKVQSLGYNRTHVLSALTGVFSLRFWKSLSRQGRLSPM